jgi:superoxide dismutase, Cu-Zn family
MKLIDLTAGLVLVASLACEEKQQTPLDRQTPADRSGAVGSADPSRTGQLLPPGTEFQRAEGKLVAKEGGSVEGDVKLEEVTSGVRVEVSVQDAPRNSKLGVVVHETGDCKDLAKGLGPHFNPRGTRHGLPGAPEQHAGDLGNVTTDAEGKGKLLILTSGGNLREGDPKSYLNRPLVIHAQEDRGTEPSGDVGEPLACARIAHD